PFVPVSPLGPVLPAGPDRPAGPAGPMSPCAPLLPELQANSKAAATIRNRIAMRGCSRAVRGRRQGDFPGVAAGKMTSRDLRQPQPAVDELLHAARDGLGGAVLVL